MLWISNTSIWICMVSQRIHPLLLYIHEPGKNNQKSISRKCTLRMWEELQERFGFPLKLWKKRFAEYLAKQKGEDEIAGVFLRFGSDSINPS